MRNRLVLLPPLALTVSACAMPHGTAQAPAAAPATTAAPATRASTATTSPARQPPRGILPTARRQAAPALQVTRSQGSETQPRALSSEDAGRG